MSGEEVCKVGAFEQGMNLLLVLSILRCDTGDKVNLMGVSTWQLQVQCAVLKHPSFKLPAFWEGMLSVSRSLRVTMWCLLVLYYFICHILLHWCLLSFKVLSKCHFSSVISSNTQCKQESWLQDEVQGISLPDIRGQDASKKLLQCLSEAVCFKGSFWNISFICSGSIILVTGSLLKSQVSHRTRCHFTLCFKSGIRHKWKSESRRIKRKMSAWDL